MKKDLVISSHGAPSRALNPHQRAVRSSPHDFVVGAAPGRSVRTCLGPPIDASEEFDYWQSHHAVQRFATQGFDYDAFAPAYRCGVVQFLREPFLSFSRAEPALRSMWPTLRGDSPLPWKIARFAARAAWEHARAKAWAIAHDQ